MKTRYLRNAPGLLLALFFAVTGSTAVAADTPAAKSTRGPITDVWVIWPKPGQSKDFEAGLKAHAAWRKSAGEEFSWSIYQPVVGANLDFYVIRSEGHNWKDMDAEEAWSAKAKSDDAYEKQVGEHASRAEHYFSEDDVQHSHWVDSKDYKYFMVTSYRLKSGTRAERMDALNKIQKAVVDTKWPYPYAIENGVGGKEPMLIVVPMKSYADMADPEPSLMKVLAKSLGSDAAATETMKHFGASVDQTDSTVYLYRGDLSTPK